MSYKVRLQIRYDGTDFEGWQRQSFGKATIQGFVEKALSQLFLEPITLLGSGRTDSGVHAEAQNAHFKTTKNPENMNLCLGLNALLPDSISVTKAWLAPEDFHAQRSAIGKTYRYFVHNSRLRDPLKHRYHTWFKKPMDIQKLNVYSEYLLGEKDFKSFQTGGSEVKTTVRKVTEARWIALSDTEMMFQITGEGFLKQMVRNIVGTIIHLEMRNLPPSEMEQILKAKDRQKAWGTAAAQGLILHKVLYPEDLDNRCREI